MIMTGLSGSIGMRGCIEDAYSMHYRPFAVLQVETTRKGLSSSMLFCVKMTTHRPSSQGAASSRAGIANVVYKQGRGTAACAAAAQLTCRAFPPCAARTRPGSGMPLPLYGSGGRFLPNLCRKLAHIPLVVARHRQSRLLVHLHAHMAIRKS